MQAVTETVLPARLFRGRLSGGREALIPPQATLQNVLRVSDTELLVFDYDGNTYSAGVADFSQVCRCFPDGSEGVAIYREDFDPLRWVGCTPMPGLSFQDWNRIKRRIMAAHATFHRAKERPVTGETRRTPGFAHIEPMREAFNGIAEVLFDADVLTTTHLEDEIPKIVWEAAVAGGWTQWGSPVHTEECPEAFGKIWLPRLHYKSWHDSLFVAETAEWRGRLLEGKPQCRDGAVPTSKARKKPKRSVNAECQALLELRATVREMHELKMTQWQMCQRLKGTPRPPHVAWRQMDWPEAFRNRQYSPSVRKWLSTNGR